MSSPLAVVVGGGIAGLSALRALARLGPALLLEREAGLCAHASGRNAAIYRPLEADETSAALARRSLALFGELSMPVLDRCGLLLVSAEQAEIDVWLAHAERQAIAVERLEGAALWTRAPSLEAGDARAGLLVPEGGVLDITRMTRALADDARSRGAEIRPSVGVARVLTAHGKVRGVELDSGESIACGAVVLAAGAWGAALGAGCGAALPLAPLRRHLIQLTTAAPLPADHPIVWRLDDELYFRAEAGGVLASPCDDVAWQPATPPVDPDAAAQLMQKLERTAPALSNARMREMRACLRTFAPDRELCVGEDARVAGLHWFAGLGGRGMAVAPAAGEVLAAAMAGTPHPLAAQLSPARFAR